MDFLQLLLGTRGAGQRLDGLHEVHPSACWAAYSHEGAGRVSFRARTLGGPRQLSWPVVSVGWDRAALEQAWPLLDKWTAGQAVSEQGCRVQQMPEHPETPGSVVEQMLTGLQL